MNFSEALNLLKAGKRLTRKCWKDNSKYVFIYQPTEIKMLQDMVGKLYRNEACRVANYTHCNHSWNPTTNDILAEDWEIVK